MIGAPAKAASRRLAPQLLCAGIRTSISLIRCAAASFLLCLVPASQAFPVQAYSARVVDVSEGDIITIEPALGGARETVRLQGIDAPELDQPYGQAAKAFVISAALHKTVYVRPGPQGTDSYDRIVAVVEVPGMGILQEMLLEAGLAWVWPRYCRNCNNWEAMQAQAKSGHRGLWADPERIPPWRWREKHKRDH